MPGQESKNRKVSGMLFVSIAKKVLPEIYDQFTCYQLSNHAGWSEKVNPLPNYKYMEDLVFGNAIRFFFR